MREIVRCVFCGFGALGFIASFFIIRFRVRLAEQQQAQNEKMALSKSGLFGPGCATPRQQLIVGIIFMSADRHLHCSTSVTEGSGRCGDLAKSRIRA
jgi:hypothetical protein